ncbi:Vacuole effluxer Atg22 like protein [compost metagenome]
MTRHSPAIHYWALYDFANTLFAMNVVSLYFALWVTQDMKAPDLAYSVAASASLLAVALLSPTFGAWSDRLGRRIPFIGIFTAICCATIAAVTWVTNLYVGLGLFIVSVFAYQMAQVSYNAMLPELAEPHEMGRVSGYGTAIGYLGSIVGVILIMPFVSGKLFGWETPIPAGGNTGAFLPVAVLFMLFSLPLLFGVKDRVKPSQEARRPGLGQLVASWKAARQVPGMTRYLVANLLFFDALNTVIGFMAIYATQVLGFDSARNEVQMVLMLATAFAFVGSFGWGTLVDRIGAKRALVMDLALWIMALLGFIVVRDKAIATWVLAPMVGIAMGGTWTASRALLANLAPPDRQGEFFGLYSLAGKFAAVLGPLTWGVITWLFASMPIGKYQLALGAQLVLVLAGLFLLGRVPDPHRNARSLSSQVG